MKKRFFVISLLAVILSLCIGGTVAFFTASDIATNVITAGNIEIELSETDAEGKPFVNVSGVMPGMQIAKIVTVKNTGDNACWVRIGVRKEIVLAEGREGTVDLSLVGLDINTADWTEKDGFYYYNQKLEPGQTTSPLFTTVSFDAAMDDMYQRSTADISVVVYAVQSDNNGAAVAEAAGWPAN